MKTNRTLALVLCALLVAACRPGQYGGKVAHRGVYHWKTTFDPTPWERQWMHDHDVDRLYVKLFEVDAGPKHGRDDWRMIPTSTTLFRQPLPADMEVVPVVYITVDAIRTLGEYDYEARSRYADLLVDRIYAMMGEHYGGTVQEVQLDCDWTQSTRDEFFLFARSVHMRLEERGATLSGTVRLHQLRDDGIPFDRKLLMVYNTGRLQDPTTRNSILDPYDVAPYLRGLDTATLRNYDIAWPAYGWGVEFDHEGKFVRLTKPMVSPYTRVERGEPSAISRVRRSLPPMQDLTVVLYHLDSTNLSYYSYEEIEDMFGR